MHYKGKSETMYKNESPDFNLSSMFFFGQQATAQSFIEIEKFRNATAVARRQTVRRKT